MSSRRRGQSGAALVEFALLAPLLIILLLGIIEFGWLFGQYNDVKHGAREGARYAAVNAGDNDEIHQHVCNAMEGLSAGMETLVIQLTGGGGNLGEVASIRVAATVSSLSGAPIISGFLPSELVSEVDFRLERNVTWTDDSVNGVAVTC